MSLLSRNNGEKRSSKASTYDPFYDHDGDECRAHNARLRRIAFRREGEVFKLENTVERLRA